MFLQGKDFGNSPALPLLVRVNPCTKSLRGILTGIWTYTIPCSIVNSPASPYPMFSMTASTTRSILRFAVLVRSWFPALLLYLGFSVSLASGQAAVGDPTLEGSSSDKVSARLLSEDTLIAPGKSFTLAVELTHQPGVTTYWLNPGTGQPTRITWKLPPGFQAGPIIWPIPKIG